VKPISASAWMEEVEGGAVKAFENHRYEEVGPGHWRLRGSDGSYYWCDIIVMAGRGLAVWGDIDGCFFAYCSGAKGPKDVVAWMANADVAYYARQKAHIGMGGVGIDCYEDVVALYELDQQLKDAEEEFEERWDKPPRYSSITPISEVYAGAIEAAKRRLDYGESVQLVQRELIDDLQGVEPDAYEWVGGLGRVTSPRVIYAIAAIRRLWELLRDPS